MADMMDTLKSLLGDNADAKIQDAMKMLEGSGLLNQSSKNSTASQNSTGTQTDLQNTGQIQQVSSQNAGFQSSGNSPLGALTPEGIQFMGQIKSMVDQISNSNDSRSNLLKSLRPFMRTERQRSIDRAIRIINIGRFSGLFGR